jgi:hypothetical protein
MLFSYLNYSFFFSDFLKLCLDSYFSKILVKMSLSSQDLVVHTYNPSYLGC